MDLKKIYDEQIEKLQKYSKEPLSVDEQVKIALAVKELAVTYFQLF